MSRGGFMAMGKLNLKLESQRQCQTLHFWWLQIRVRQIRVDESLIYVNKCFWQHWWWGCCKGCFCVYLKISISQNDTLNGNVEVTMSSINTRKLGSFSAEIPVKMYHRPYLSHSREIINFISNLSVSNKFYHQ